MENLGSLLLSFAALLAVLDLRGWLRTRDWPREQVEVVPDGRIIRRGYVTVRRNNGQSAQLEVTYPRYEVDGYLPGQRIEVAIDPIEALPALEPKRLRHALIKPVVIAAIGLLLLLIG